MKLRHKPIRYIVIHCSDTRDSDSLSWGAIRNNHTNRGWSDIGYHAGAEEVRGGLECLYGRPDPYVGAHCYGKNSVSLGFCFVGRFDDVPPSDELLAAAAGRVIVPWLKQYDLGVEAIVPHRDFAMKTCPGAAFDIERLRAICSWSLER